MRLLVVKPSSLGDIVHGLLVVETLRRARPGVHVTWVASEAFAALLQVSCTVDEVIVFPRHGSWSERWRFFRDLRKMPFDVVWDLQGLARSALITLAAKAPRQTKLGRADAREGARLAYGHRVYAAGATHAVERLAAFLPTLAVAADVSVQLQFRAVLPLIEKLEQVRGAPWIFFPESRRREKQWPYFADLARIALVKGVSPVIWAGAGSTRAPVADGIVDLGGKLALAQLPALIARASLVVANDSGPLHLAAAQGKPVVGLFGPTSSAQYGPWPPGCSRHACLDSPDALEELSTERVFRKSAELAAKV